MNRGCPEWPFYGQHGALTSTPSRVSTMYWTGCLLVPEAARSQNRSQSQVTPVGDPLPWGSNHVTQGQAPRAAS
jgi:hypothetical protein